MIEHQSGADLGIPPPDWHHPTGERLDTRYVSFHDRPAEPPEPPDQQDAAA